MYLMYPIDKFGHIHIPLKLLPTMKAIDIPIIPKVCLSPLYIYVCVLSTVNMRFTLLTKF